MQIRNVIRQRAALIIFGLLYHAPNFELARLDANALTHTAEPSAGVVFRF